MLIKTLFVSMLCTIYNPDYNPSKSEQRGVPICDRNVSTSIKKQLYMDAGIEDTDGWCINHVVPLAVGGSNDLSNLEPMRVDQNGKCHAPNEVKAIYCFMYKKCTQIEAFNILGFENIEQP